MLQKDKIKFTFENIIYELTIYKYLGIKGPLSAQMRLLSQFFAKSKVLWLI